MINSKTATSKLIIADDQRVFLNGLCLLLDNCRGLTVVESIIHLNGLLPSIEHHRPDIVLVPTQTLSASKAILDYCKARYPETKIIFLLNSNNRLNYFKLNKSTADGFVFKEESFRVIRKVISQVSIGKKALSPKANDFFTLTSKAQDYDHSKLNNSVKFEPIRYTNKYAHLHRIG